MAQIIINEVSQNYTYNIGRNSFACVALPITACWGPGFFDYAEYGLTSEEEMLERTAWTRFPATQAGLESFVATFRGPAANYRLAEDYSYQMAMTLLTAGYDVLVCRLSPGKCATGQLPVKDKYGKGVNVFPGEGGDDAVVAEASGDKVSLSFSFSIPFTPSADDSFELKIADDTKEYKFVSSEVILNEDKSDYETIVFKDGKTIAMRFVKTDADTLALEMDPGYTTGLKLIEGNTYHVNLVVKHDQSVDVLDDEHPGLKIFAKYPGTFANNIRAEIKKQSYRVRDSKAEHGFRQQYYWNLIISIIDESGIKTSVENKTFVFEIENSTDTILHISEIESNFVRLEAIGKILDSGDTEFVSGGHVPVGYSGLPYSDLSEGTDKAADPEGDDVYTQLLDSCIDLATTRYGAIHGTTDADYGEAYEGLFAILKSEPEDISRASMLRYKEWLYTKAVTCSVSDNSGNLNAGEGVYDLLKDKLTYNPQRIISPGWDDQDVKFIYPDIQFEDSVDSSGYTDTYPSRFPISPLHAKLMEVAYYGRCATSILDIPRSLERRFVYSKDDESKEDLVNPPYAQKLARFIPDNTEYDVNGSLYQTHSALFAPWGKYTYVGTSKQVTASPAFLALMIQRAQILNQPNQYEWALPTNRKHNLRIGKMDYNVSKKYMDRWQKLEGVGVNIITTIPDLGTNIWGNSTLFEVPPATYQALANLSTRYLVNAVEDVVYRVGIGITFSYNNEQAYNRFYAGCTPILDTMKNMGAIDGYYVKMSADINGLDQVNANTVIGKIYLIVNGVINDIIVDLVALPPGTDLTQFQG